jgi:4-carboxymuconolactone decarboxylase
MSDDKFERGEKMRRAVLGDAYVDAAEANKSDFDAGWQQFITEVAWGTVWQGEALERPTRHLITIAILAALGKEHELAMHIRATQNTGVTAEQLKELFMQVAAYAGIPAANRAMAIAKRVLAENP